MRQVFPRESPGDPRYDRADAVASRMLPKGGDVLATPTVGYNLTGGTGAQHDPRDRGQVVASSLLFPETLT